MQAKDLKPNPKNPNLAGDERITMLKAAMEEFGDISGIVYNRTTKHLVGGHHRLRALPPSAKVVITQELKKPTKSGTLAIGYMEYSGERYAYREVKWDKTVEKAAMLAANRGAGTMNDALVGDLLKEIDLDGAGFDMSLTMFDADEFDELYPEGLPSGREGKKGTAPTRRTVVCPKCACEFTPAPKA